jgi:hypothetical protein
MNIRIKKNEENQESKEVLADAVIRIADGFEKLLATKLNDDAIIQLLMGMSGMAGISKRDVRLVLSNLKRLKSWYIR